MNTVTAVVAVILVVGMGVLAFFAERGGEDSDTSGGKDNGNEKK